MRFHWLLLSFFSFLLFATPAQAGKLLFWRFETNDNRLIFTTDDRVQPKAQLISNPTRIVIDLPGIILGQPSVTKPIGGLVKSIRVGQFDAQTTRLVIEIAPGYTVDPQRVKIRGLSPTQWTVELPAPERIDPASPTPSPVDTPPPLNTSEQPSNPSPDRTADPSDFQVTRNGLFVRLDRNGDDRKIRIKRSRDGQKIDFDLPGATLPKGLSGQTFPVNNYGIGEIEFDQSSKNTAHITLSVGKNSPDWQALYSRFGGLVLLPRGGLNALDSNIPSPTPTTSIQSENPPTDRRATIQSVDLSGSGTYLTIRADRAVQASGNWNRNSGVYEIRINNARLANNFRGPQLGRNSPIYKLRIREEFSNTVVLIIQPSLGYQFGQLTQPNNQLLSLELRSLRTPPDTTSNPTTIQVPQVPTTSPSSPPKARNGKILVIIDPGHGGKDPGAIGIGGLQEKDVILPISLEVARLLEQQGIQVMLSRSNDYFVSLQGRTDMANRASADLFVSIHANSMGKGRPDVNGLEVYYYGDRRLSDAIHRNIVRSVSIRDRGVRRARFYVLKNSKMPSTLVEVGFITGNEDSRNLKNSTYQRQMAAAIARGIIEYLQQNR